MAFDEGLAQRVRELVGAYPGASERRMFGGLAFLLHGKMFVGIVGETLMARVGAERYGDSLALPHVRPMDFTGKPMSGYVYVDPPGIAEDEQLLAWVNWCAGVAAALPARAPVKSRAAAGPAA
jgi:TfoX/Sxy family transcriptional regulator of competence genes